MRIGIWSLTALVVGLVCVASGFLITVQVFGPHGRLPRYGAAAPPQKHFPAESLN